MNDNKSLVSVVEIIIFDDIRELVCVISLVVRGKLTLVILVAENVVGAVEMIPSSLITGFIFVIVVIFPGLYLVSAVVNKSV